MHGVCVCSVFRQNKIIDMLHTRYRNAITLCHCKIIYLNEYFLMVDFS